MPHNVTKLYRYDDGQTQDEVIIHLHTFFVMEETRCGYWYSDMSPLANVMLSNPSKPKREKWRWVSKTARVRRCYPTKSQAWNSFLKRKQKQYGYLNRQLGAVASILRHAPITRPPDSFELDIDRRYLE